MRLLHRHRNKQKHSPPLPCSEDHQSPFTSITPLPPIRNFSYPAAVLQTHSTTLPESAAQSSGQSYVKDASQNPSTKERPLRQGGGIETPFYWASSYIPLRGEENFTSADLEISTSTSENARNTSQSQQSGEESQFQTSRASSRTVISGSFKKASLIKRFHIRHQIAKSVDLSSAYLPRSTSTPRPASSSGIAAVDTRTYPHKIGLAIEEEDNHPGTFLELVDDEMGLRRRISEMDLRMSPPRRMLSDQMQQPDPSAIAASANGNPTKIRPEEKLKAKDGKTRWVNQLKDWFNVGEPSSQDWKQLKKQEFHRHGIAMNDPDASAKLHAPIGAIPEEAIKPSSGPDPEVIAKKRAANRKQLPRAYGGCERTSGSISSESSTGSKEVNPIAPWA
ncbi:hypothetical protein CI238_04231 [Colletotrichum incanum]|uniref:Uncharacterized protein n=1 Tax=Colletotrichum incanum TaxID=1573173 RepID=A0A162P4Z9_COLIC|nr:hypothetical protein CI238_04231 [Colletotrichum incanum]